MILMFDEEKKDIGKWWMWFLFLCVVSGIIITGLNYAGYLTSTLVERKVFEHSYQRSEALKSQIAVDESTIAEIQQKLLNPDLDKGTKFNLKAQISAARIRISTARRKQK